MASDEPYGNDVRELSLYDAGISSLSELSELPRMTQLHSLNLHCNRIKAIACVEPLTQLKYLNLSSNLIETMGGLHTLARLQTLDLSQNLLTMDSCSDPRTNNISSNATFNTTNDSSNNSHIDASIDSRSSNNDKIILGPLPAHYHGPEPVLRLARREPLLPAVLGGNQGDLFNTFCKCFFKIFS